MVEIIKFEIKTSRPINTIIKEIADLKQVGILKVEVVDKQKIETPRPSIDFGRFPITTPRPPRKPLLKRGD